MTPEIQEAINAAVKTALTAVGKAGSAASEVIDDAGNVYKLVDSKVDKFLVRFARKDFSTGVIIGIWLVTALGGIVVGWILKGSPDLSTEVVLPKIDF